MSMGKAGAARDWERVRACARACARARASNRAACTSETDPRMRVPSGLRICTFSTSNLKSHSPCLKPFWAAKPRHTPATPGGVEFLQLAAHAALLLLPPVTVCMHMKEVALHL